MHKKNQMEAEMQLIEGNPPSERSLFDREASSEGQYVGGQGGESLLIIHRPTYQPAGDSRYQMPEGDSRGRQLVSSCGKFHNLSELSSLESPQRKPRRQRGDRLTMSSGSTEVHRMVDRLSNREQKVRYPTKFCEDAISTMIWPKQRNPHSQRESKKSNPLGKDVKFVNTVAHYVLRLLKKRKIITAQACRELIGQKMNDTVKFNWIIMQSKKNGFEIDFKYYFWFFAEEVTKGKKTQVDQLRNQENDGCLSSDRQSFLDHCISKIQFLEEAVNSLEAYEISGDDTLLNRYRRNKKTGRKYLWIVR